MNLAMKNINEITEFDRILDAIENTTDPRVDLLKEGHNAIYRDENISREFSVMIRSDGKCFFIKANTELRKNEIVRELNSEEYSKIDLKKGRDY